MTKEEIDFEVREFKPKEASKEEWARFHAYRRARLAETDRQDDYFPDEETEVMAKRDDPFGEQIRFHAKDGQEVIGSFGSYIQNPTAPGYESNKHLLGVNFAILTPYRRKGIGTQFLRKALELMEKHDKSVATFGTEEDDGHAFLKAIGAEAKSEGAENRLYLEDVDWDMVGRWVKEGKERNPETELVFFENRVPEDQLEEFCEVMTVLANTMPFDDLDHGEIVMTPELFKEWYDQMDQLKTEHHTYLTKEPDGTISGATDVGWGPQKPDRVWQNFTGVHPDHRGRGLGKWLKAAMLEFLRTRYPEVTFISTGNANSNDPMLAINRRLGFKTHKGGAQYQMSREDLAKYLSTRS